MAIKVLDRDTIEKITAGEVVERPVSVVKELVENSIDAGATLITVEIREGGLEYMRITDNGCGIPANEVKLAFQSHATSKLQSAEGLSSVMTMGFRGEALPSIAAIAKVTLTTKTRSSDTGVKIKVEAGEITDVQPAGCPDGTTIVVNDLFYNVPVRKTFIRKPAYEQSLVSELVQKLALGNPSIGFKMISSGKTLFQTFGDGDILHAALAVFGSSYASGLKKIDESEGTFDIKGYIGVGDQAAVSRGRQCFFLNGRIVNCRMLSQALEEACKGRVTIGKYPSCVLLVSIPTGSVDVNVHPGKLEVRFRDEASFRLTAQTLLSRCFREERMLDMQVNEIKPIQPKIELAPKIEPKQATEMPEKPKSDILQKFKSFTTNEVKPKESGFSVRESAIPFAPSISDVKPSEKPTEAQKEKAETVTGTVLPKPEENAKTEQDSFIEAKNEEENYRLIGTYLDTYILLECGDSLVMIDQHAAHERLNYEEYTRRLEQGIASQMLLVPMILDVTPREEQVISDNMQVLTEAGYEVEMFGHGSLKVTAVPYIYGQSDLKLLFADMVDSLELLKKAEKERRMTSIIQASCKHAVKAGDKLTDGEIRSLLKAMSESGAAPTCPHGRPVLRVFTKRSVEQLFKRIQ